MQFRANQRLRETLLPAIKGAEGVAWLSPAPRCNRILAALPQADLDRLLPELEFVALPRGTIVYGADERQSYLYFPTSGLAARFITMDNGKQGAFGVTGREGVLGIASFLGGDHQPCESAMLVGGGAYRLPATLLRGEFERGGPLLPILMRDALARVAQTGQAAVCNRHHDLVPRLCSFILSCLDRIDSHELEITQEVLAGMMGVRRESITAAEAELQLDGIIHHARGGLVVHDRRRLEAKACECYAVVRCELERLAPGERGRSALLRCGDWHAPPLMRRQVRDSAGAAR